jgi:uncharacterized protein (TIGR03083 family)
VVDRPAAYEQGRVRITELLRERGQDVGERRVPACPDWSVKDLVAHLQHVTEEYSAGRHPYATLDRSDTSRFDDPARNDTNEAWADDGVAARRGQSLEQLLDAWATTSQQLYRMMTDEPALPDADENDYLAWSALGDFAIHYQDMHGALGLEGDRDAYCAKVGFATLPILFCSHASTVPGVPGLRLVTQRGEVAIGDGEPVVHEVDWFELYRAISGRRTRAQIAALLSPLDAELYLPAFTLYPFAAAPLTT